MTGFDGINVQHGALDQGSADVMAAAKDIQNRLDMLEGDLKPLAGAWDGAAREAYAQAKAKWDQAIGDMIVLLGQASQNVSTSNEEYKAADIRGANRF